MCTTATKNAKDHRGTLVDTACGASGVSDKVSDKVEKKFKNGDVVRITGLTRAAHLNGLLAEVQHYNYDEKKGEPRYAIMYTIKESCQIRQSSIKPENIEVHLRVHEAAELSTRIRKRDCSTKAQQKEAMNSYVEVQNTVLPTLSGGQIVERLKRDDNDLLATLLLPISHGGKSRNLTLDQVKEILQSGIIDCCLQRYEYPRCLDGSLEEDIANDDPSSEQQSTRNAQWVQFLANLLNKNQGPSFEATMNQYRIEAAKKMAPLIMLCASKKRRFLGKTELWWGFNMALSSLLQNCLIADAAVSHILLHKFEPKVTEALLEHVIFSYTVDEKQYLHKNSVMMKKNGVAHQTFLKMVIIPSLMELADINNVGQAVVARIGNIKVPEGVRGMTGQPFAKCLLRCSAVLALEELNSPHSRRGGLQVMEEIQYLYGCFWKCPDLNYMLGDFDTELAEVENPSQLKNW
eukprot:CAMPEP_0203669746 /NCGR_PEP_ID=MMETSP0090-20130426/6028_1 /ASSEMBLY_ACC=CAM_ASM_001088 /TAXON_ID=426623 /ORGANISM="Chaetoceros affinis, Strain CCMP159" /LENGTH=461 /DNA_ID=CAMNT_0050534483 /DNA_START=149 /DNA_END=1530 /DNA_ORIENTATION=-